MSAGICIMNRNAIALAADSAVTIGNHAAIHNSANKVFSLSRIAPVGIIVYADASFMSVPIEIIIKEYRKHLGNKTFPQLQDYVTDFISYIEKKSEFFHFNINEQNYIENVVFNLWQGLEIGYKEFGTGKLKSLGRNLNEYELLEIANAACQQTIEYVNSFKKIPTNFYPYLISKYKIHFLEKLKNEKAFSWMSEEQRLEIVDCSLKLFDTKFERNGYLGIAIAGYGDEEIYPSLFHLHFSGTINGKLRYFEEETVSISERQFSSITPLAQTDVMETFLFGINDRFLNDLSREIPIQINKCINTINDSSFDNEQKQFLQKQFQTVTNNIINHMLYTARQDYMRPILESVATLPIEELALLSESMINITSIRRKVALDNNIGTVGGPIDVAIISKGDGFIWLKRKHYFDGKYNPQYYYSHFEKKERSYSNYEENS